MTMSPGYAIATTKRAESYWRQALSGVTVATPLGLDGSLASAAALERSPGAAGPHCRPR